MRINMVAIAAGKWTPSGGWSDGRGDVEEVARIGFADRHWHD
jgi:hypothetical protein